VPAGYRRLTRYSRACRLASRARARPVRMDDVADIAEGKAGKTRYVDNGWPATDPDDHAVSELATDRTGALSPFGDVVFPVPSDDLPYVHPVTVVNR
jgi:hypothetical protein